MAVPVQTPIEVTTLPQGQTLTTLNFTFKYVDTSTVDVSVNNVELLETQYNVVGQVVTFTPPIVGITGGSKVIVYLNMVYSRTNDLIQSSPIYVSDLNKQLDRITLMLQQSEFGVGKSIIFAPTDTEGLNTTLPVASLRANRALVFNTDGSVGVGGDLYTNQVALCQAQVTLATAQATNSANSATVSQAWATQLLTPVSGSDYSAKYNANISQAWAESSTDVIVGHPSAKTWATIASVIAIPNGSITTNKLSVSDIFVVNGISISGNNNFYSALSGVDVQTDITARNGWLHATKNGIECYTSLDDNIAFAGICQGQNRRVYLKPQGLPGNRGGVSIRDYNQTTESFICAGSNDAWGWGTNISEWSQIVRQVDLTPVISTGSVRVVYPAGTGPNKPVQIFGIAIITAGIDTTISLGVIITAFAVGSPNAVTIVTSPIYDINGVTTSPSCIGIIPFSETGQTSFIKIRVNGVTGTVAVAFTIYAK